jgi:hypothetical protein
MIGSGKRARGEEARVRMRGGVIGIEAIGRRVGVVREEREGGIEIGLLGIMVDGGTSMTRCGRRGGGGGVRFKALGLVGHESMRYV